MSLPEPIEVSQIEAPVCSQQKEIVFVLGGSGGTAQTESTVLWPFSKRDHLSPELGLATPAFTAMVRQKGTWRVDVTQQASRINQHLFHLAHTPPVLLPSHSLPSLLHPYQLQPVSVEHSLRERRERRGRCVETWGEKRSHPASAEVSQSPYCHVCWGTVQQRREVGKLCDTVKTENLTHKHQSGSSIYICWPAERPESVSVPWNISASSNALQRDSFSLQCLFLMSLTGIWYKRDIMDSKAAAGHRIKFGLSYLSSQLGDARGT